MLINLQTCTIPYFKGNFIITDLFLYHGWTTVASGAARDENASLLFFVTPSIKYRFFEKVTKIWLNLPYGFDATDKLLCTVNSTEMYSKKSRKVF